MNRRFDAGSACPLCPVSAAFADTAEVDLAMATVDHAEQLGSGVPGQGRLAGGGLPAPLQLMAEPPEIQPRGSSQLVLASATAVSRACAGRTQRSPSQEQAASSASCYSRTGSGLLKSGGNRQTEERLRFWHADQSGFQTGCCFRRCWPGFNHRCCKPCIREHPGGGGNGRAVSNPRQSSRFPSPCPDRSLAGSRQHRSMGIQRLLRTSRQRLRPRKPGQHRRLSG